MSKSPLIGPHEGRELALMLQGSKPLSVFFIESPDEEWSEFPEKEFDLQVRLQKFVKFEQRKIIKLRTDTEVSVRTVFYSLKDEEWRIRAFVFLDSLYQTLGAGYRPDLERAMGGLLGYSTEEIEGFLQHLAENNMIK